MMINFDGKAVPTVRRFLAVLMLTGLFASLLVAGEIRTASAHSDCTLTPEFPKKRSDGKVIGKAVHKCEKQHYRITVGVNVQYYNDGGWSSTGMGRWDESCCGGVKFVNATDYPSACRTWMRTYATGSVYNTSGELVHAATKYSGSKYMYC